MNFTQKELVIMSNGILALIRDAEEAKKLICSNEAQFAIDKEICDLVSLNGKLCDMMKE